MIRFNMATIESRTEQFKKVISSLREQTVPCEIYCHFNYTPNPYLLSLVDSYTHSTDLGDRGKFNSIGKMWNLFVDDDILYPKDYAERMVRKSDELNCPVGVHGSIILPKVEDYFKDRAIFPFYNANGGGNVNCLGTGTLCFNSQKVKFSMEDMPLPNMSDCYFAVYCQTRKIPMYCISRMSRWLNKLETTDSLYNGRFDHEKQTTIIKKVKEWKIHY